METIRTACIVMPTYNEAGNITKVLDTIYSYVHKQKAVRVLTLVVDDNSPDGTGALAEAYGARNPNVKVLHRTGKEGLGAAYIAGMKYALREFEPDVILEMDADLSHNPKDVLHLIAAIEEGADVVIGSRYVAGGTVPDHWGFYRKLNSATANALVRNVLSLRRVKDCTGGFRAIRSTYLEQIDFDNLKTKGYAFQISLLHQLASLGATIAEVPIHFADREIGVSKMRLKDQLDFIATTFKIRASRIRRSPARTASTRAVAARRVKP
jgi:dolichol-phosphate mannosyltransferase